MHLTRFFDLFPEQAHAETRWFADRRLTVTPRDSRADEAAHRERAIVSWRGNRSASICTPLPQASGPSSRRDVADD